MKKRYTAACKAKLVLELLKEEKTLSQLASEHQVHPNQLRQWRDLVLREMASLFDRKSQTADLVAAHQQEVEELYAEIGKLTTQLNWLKKNLVSSRPRAERVALVEWRESDFAIKTQAELLGLNRTGLYYQPVAPSAEEVALKHRIDELYTASPFYGSRRITACLKREGQLVNRKQVQRHRREMGIEGIAAKPNLSRALPGQQVFPYLLKGLAINKPNQVWGIDSTYIRLLAGWLYLVAIIDWYSRYVVSWELDDSLEVDFVLLAVERAFSQAKPEIFNSDQGSQFTSQAYIGLVEGAGVRISMDSKGRAFDNIFTERLWRTVKYEDVYIKGYTTPRETRVGLGSYLGFYNDQRVHQALAYRTPAEVHFGYSMEKA